MAESGEEIVMTPFKKGRSTCIRYKKTPRKLVDQSQVEHQGAGRNAGLVINKQNAGGNATDGPAHLKLQFMCFLVNNNTGKHVPENRVLKFWFSEDTDYLDRVTAAYEFFKELVKPDRFPRDYVGFMKKVMVQMKSPPYTLMRTVEVELTQLEEKDLQPPSSSVPSEDHRSREVIVQEQVLHTLEHAYPNILPLEELAKLTHIDENLVKEQLQVLQGRSLIRELEPDKWVRKVLDEKTEVKVIKNMPQQTAGQKPTIAIITSKYYEKLAVDAMMEDKTTYVRFKTEGESNVYTIGVIGPHKVVSTKIPALGRQMAAQISSGNTTTRLLGTFSDIDHVFLVGVAGGVPHYTDFYKHVRLGDVVFGTPNEKGQLYIYCDDVMRDAEQGSMQFKLKSWGPHENSILDTFNTMQEEIKDVPMACPWDEFITEGQQHLQGQEVNFDRPAPETDRLYMNIGGNDIIEVGHPPIPDDAEGWYSKSQGQPMVRQGTIGAGKPIVQDNALRQDFAVRHGCTVFDTEFDQVLESIVGNRKESFAIIRGVADYLDGTKDNTWQPYAALVAAAFTKNLISRLPAVN